MNTLKHLFKKVFLAFYRGRRKKRLDSVETLRDRVHRIEEKDMIHFEGEKASKGGRHFNRDDEEVKALEVKLKEKFKSM